MRRGNFKDALSLVNQALLVWNADREVYLPEISRTSFLKAKILYRMDGDRAASTLLFRQAASGWKSVTRTKEVEYEKLTEEHFDDLVTFWSK